MPGSSRSTPFRSALNVERLEDRTVPTFLARTPLPTPALVNGQPLPQTSSTQMVGGESIAVGDVIPEANPLLTRNEYVVGTGPGTVGKVSVFDSSGNMRYQFVPFAGFTGGLNVAVGDVIGDGAAEIIVTVAGNGPPTVGVFTPSGQMLSSFVVGNNASYTGGLNVAVGNVLGGIGAGGFSGGGNSQFKSEIILGTASSLPAVIVTDAYGNIEQNFFAFNPAFGVGVTVAAANIDTTRVAGFSPGTPDTNAYDEIIVGAASRFPAVSIWDVWQGSPTQLQMYFAFDPANPLNQTGVTVAAGSTDGFRGAEVYVGITNSSRIRAFNGQSGSLIAEFTAFPSDYSHVVNMAVGNVTSLFNSTDDTSGNFGLGGNPAFNFGDLVVVAGDAAYFQRPRLFFGGFTRPAGLNGP